MRREITPHRIANEVRMLRTRFQGAFLIVEGPTDAKTFFNLIDKETCRLVIAYSKANAMMAIDIIDSNKVRGVLAIVDADFLIAEGKDQAQGNLILTDTHDLETMLLSSDAFIRVVADLLPAEQLDKASTFADRCLSSLLIIGVKIGFLRWVNELEALDLRFHELPYSRFVDPTAQDVEVSQMLDVAKYGAGQLKLTDAEIFQRMREMEEIEHDPWQVCQGHDLINLLELILPNLLQQMAGREAANSSRTKMRAEVIDRSLRLAFTFEDLRETSVHRLALRWQDSNSPYKVFPS